MKQTKTLSLALMLLLAAAFSSCKKVIEVNLNSVSPLYVTEGNVTNQPPPYLVTITKSINFDQDNVAPTVSGALVVITDSNFNQADTLREVTPGNYYTNITDGIPGHTYRLYVNAGGNVFTASSTMPAPVTLDSLYAKPAIFGKDYDAVPVYTDPVATGNYYHFDLVRNDTLVSNVFVRSDALINGQVISQPLNGGDLIAGDSVTVTLECIDRPVYEFYSTLQQTEDQNSATPANPVSNITGGTLGYFSAHTVSALSIVVP